MIECGRFLIDSRCFSLLFFVSCGLFFRNL